MPLSTEHERAKFAYDKVIENYQSKAESEKQKFESWAEKLPSMIVSCGLLQAVAFYGTKREGEPFCKIINEWVKARLQLGDDNFDTLEWLTHSVDNLQQYLYISDEVLKLSIWVKKMAKALKGKQL